MNFRCLVTIITHHGSAIRDYIYVADLAKAHVAARIDCSILIRLMCDICNWARNRVSVLEMITAFEQLFESLYRISPDEQVILSAWHRLLRHCYIESLNLLPMLCLVEKKKIRGIK